MNPENCTPCCAEPINTVIPGPEGPQGTDGTAGTNGIDAWTVTLDSFVIPAIGANVTITVGATQWMGVGQNIFVEGGGTFQVVSKADDNHFVGTYLNYASNTSSGGSVNAGQIVSPGGYQIPAAVPLSVYGAGTAYSLTATPALINMGTTDPLLVISAAGTYLLLARVRFDYNAKTTAAVRTVTTKLRRTNNTASDITGTTCAWLTEIITTLTFTAQVMTVPTVVYTTTNTTDQIEMWASMDNIAGAGTVDVTEASIVAVKLF